MFYLLRRKMTTMKKANTFFVVIIMLLVSFISIGYSALNQNLMIAGDVNYEYKSNKLYDVLRKAAKNGIYAAEYTGNHQDSFAGDGDQKIYHWYAINDTNGTAIQNMNNVIFAGQCWQMIRTTDTGGVKMIYNGEVENNQCLNTRGIHIGYGSRTSQNLASNYYYGTSYEYDSTNNVFNLSGVLTQATWNATTGPTLVGKYTCKQTTDSGTCANLYLVESYYNTSSGYVIPITKNSNYSQFGTLAYNTSYDSPAYVGYMYNTVYPVTSKSNSFTVTSGSAWTINTNYYYSDTIDWNTTTANRYTLLNPQQLSTLSGDYSSLVGKYVLDTTGTNSTTARYVTAVDSNKVYYKELSGGDLNTSLTIGESYTESGGVYTLSGNVTNVPYETWYSTSNFSIYKGKYVCDGANTSCSNIKHIYAGGNPTKNSYSYFDTTTTYSYAEDVSFNGTTYTLTGDVKTFWDLFDSTNQGYLSTHHYTCLGNGSGCTTVGYVNYLDTILYYVQLSGVTDVDAALNNMLYASDVNTKNSTIKTGIDAWYAKYLSSYDSYLEDTIFCNDRTIRGLGAWKPDSGLVTSTNSYLQFQEYTATKDLSCDRVTDQFSTLNTGAQLTYKVGLMSNPEMNLLNNSKARVTGQYYWLASPHCFNLSDAFVRRVYTSGSLSGSNTYNTYGLRPAVSLAPGTEYVAGNGSMANPYIVDATPSTLSLNESSLRFRESGGTSTLVATTNMQGTIIWESSNPSVATVDSNGLVTAVSLGTTTVTARLDSLSASATVEVLIPFEYDSWETIIENAQNNNISDYHVGDTRTITLGNDLGTHTLRVANTSTPSACFTTGFSQSACGFVLEFADIITTNEMSSNNTNVGGWPASLMYTYLNDTSESTSIINSLPEVLRNAIIDTTVVSGHGSTSGETNFTSIDKLYLLSTHEIWKDVDGNTNNGIDYYDTAYNSTRQLDYYEGLNVTTSNYSGAIKQYDYWNDYWWLRSAHSSYTAGHFFFVVDDGVWDADTPGASIGVSPAFRLSTLIPAPESFATDSWETIAVAVRTNNMSDYHVGDTKSVDMGSLGTHTIRVANMSTPNECSTTGFSQTACGFVLEFVDVITTHNINDRNSNEGGWPASAMRTYVNGTIYNALPSELKNAIINTTVVSGHGTRSSETNFTSTDKLYLLSTHEVWKDVDGNTNSGIDFYDTAYNNTRQLDYYQAQGVTTRNYAGGQKQLNGSNSDWWLRSAYFNDTSSYFYGTNYFLCVGTSGGWSNPAVIYAEGVSPAFRIG